ncbi:AAA family ATPase [Paenibacillus sp. IHBB 10380]|uniref:AAA family ATPase n=1 Tax=Paenibacillus sp. IHBB 10380 TaxID=1566358 RepID=UPI0005CFE802|nr:SMC family ATPase [Paenibacillus sp. IHBB 10380]AJS59234.1 hypothetical protein UB51_13020 [Paenibacillus sp. IHBB 10380]
MIPLRIELQNFRAIAYADIDLSAVTLAAIAGKNGAGKSSAFTLSPRFALFGDVVKGVSLDDLVRKGSQEMAVKFDFEHQGSVYRAIRTRSTKGKGKSTLELQKQVNGQWESRSAEKIADTEAVIRNLLNLDDETFTASSMILQGQANAFTGATAGRRKEVVSQILGLNVYEQLQERSRQRAAILHIDIEKNKDKLLTLDDRLSGRSVKETELTVAEDQHNATQDLIVREEHSVRAVEAQLNELKVKAARIEQISKDISVINDEITALRTEQAGHIGRLDRAEKILANETQIAEKSVELELLKQKIAMLEARQPEADRLQRDLSSSLADLHQNNESIATLGPRIVAIQRQLSESEKLKQQADSYETELERLQVYEGKADQWNLLVAELNDTRAQHSKEESRLALEERVLTDKITGLEKQEAHLHDSGCLVTCKYQQEATLAVEELPELRRQLTELDRTELDKLTFGIDGKQQQQVALEYDNAAHKANKVKVDELREAATAFAQLSGKDELLLQLQRQHADTEGRKTAIELRTNELSEQLITLTAALAPLPELTVKAVELERWAKLKDQIVAARETKQNAQERIIAIDQEVASKQTRTDELTNEHGSLVLDSLEFDTLQSELEQLQSRLAQQRGQLTTLAEQIGGIKAVLAALEVDQQERDKLKAEMEPKSQRWTRYQVLIKAFGRDGIPALIIENAVPQLERIANEILGQMSKGKHYVRFETQRELKSRDGVSETLDIMIGDWSAERPYETFSGGEQLRIDYAIRFALAELLAQRAGSKVEWLTIDEGLGSQDAEHRALVLESIKSVAGRFKKVLVITHIEDAQGAFDQVIRFDNAEGGVEVFVA